MLAVIVVLAAFEACGKGGSNRTAQWEGSNDALKIYRAHCGACHVPVTPQTLGHDELMKDLLRHRDRVRLSESQWNDLVNALAATRSIHRN
jgi:mono/diheme cytochrome c family protein